MCASMKFNVAPSTLLNPRISFGVFLFVFFFPVIPLISIENTFVLLCGTAYFYAGTLLVRKTAPVQWPKCKPNPLLVVTILAIKAFLLAHSFGFDFSVENIVTSLIDASIAQKENVAGGIAVNTFVALLMWHSLIGFCQRGKLYAAIAILLAFQLLSLQTGRFLLISQLGLLIIINHEIHGKTFNRVVIVTSVVMMAAIFPLLHAARSGDFEKDVDVYSYEYISDILASDASPGRNFLDLARHVEDTGYNYGKYLAIAPIQFMPRFLWSDKPTTSLQAVYTGEIYGLDHLEGVTFTFTIFDSYSFLGIFSVAVMSFIWGAVFMTTYNKYNRSKTPFMRIQLGLLVVNSFNFFRGNVLDFAAPIILSIAIALVLDRLGGHQQGAAEHRLRAG